MTEELTLKGTLVGHSDWVTQVTTHPQNPDLVVSVSRDKSLIVWNIKDNDDDFSGNYGKPKLRLRGHGHFLTDVALSMDGLYALTGSWDKTLRLWDLERKATTRRFEGHTNDVMSVAFSPDNRQIVSGSRDNTIKLWNTLGQCKYSMSEATGGHTNWVSCVRFANAERGSIPTIVSTGWDRVVKVWNLATCTIKMNHYGHQGYVNTVCVSPDGSLCATGGKDFKVILWDLNENHFLWSFEHNDEIRALCFSHKKYWLCVGTGASVKIWDLQTKLLLDELKNESTMSSKKGSLPAQCTSLAWSSDASTLFVGYTDGQIRVWQLGAGDNFNSADFNFDFNAEPDFNSDINTESNVNADPNPNEEINWNTVSNNNEDSNWNTESNGNADSNPNEEINWNTESNNNEDSNWNTESNGNADSNPNEEPNWNTESNNHEDSNFNPESGYNEQQNFEASSDW